MGRMSEYAIEQQEQDNLSGAFDAEFEAWVAAHEDEAKLNNTVQTESANSLPH